MRMFRVGVTIPHYLKFETILNFYQCFKNSTRNQFAQRLHKSFTIRPNKILYSKIIQSKIMHSSLYQDKDNPSYFHFFKDCNYCLEYSLT